MIHLMKYINKPIGMGTGEGTGRDTLHIGVTDPKCWVVSAIGIGVGLASSLLGGASAARQARRAQARQRQQEGSERAWYDRRYNEDYVDTAAGQNLVRRAKDAAREQWRKAAGAQAVAGGTDAATAQAKEAGTRMIGDTIANIAAQDTQRKANVDAMHRQAEQTQAAHDVALQQTKAQNITNATQAASNAIIGASGVLEQGLTGASSLKGGSNGGVIRPTVDPSVVDGSFHDRIKVDTFGG